MTDYLTGVYTALVTPFDRRGELDLSRLRDLAAFQHQAGVDGLVIAGTNGEGPSLSVDERMRLLEAAMDAAPELPIIAGTGAPSVRDAVTLTRHASEVGCAGVLVLPPYFYQHASPAGLARAFDHIAHAASVPMILYSIPQFSGIAVGPDVLRHLSDNTRIIGVKESSGEVQASKAILQGFPPLKLFIGSDDLASELLQAGAAGIISGTANAFPELLVAVWRAYRAASGLPSAQSRLDAAIRIVRDYPVVANMKAVLALRGVADLAVRAPLLPLDPDQVQSLRRRLDAEGLL